MRIILALMLAVGLFAIGEPVFADDNDTTAGYVDTTSKWCHKHQVYVGERRDPLGLGLDLTLYETGPVEVVAEGKYDFQNDETSGYLVAKINLFKVVKDIIE